MRLCVEFTVSLGGRLWICCHPHIPVPETYQSRSSVTFVWWEPNDARGYDRLAPNLWKGNR